MERTKQKLLWAAAFLLPPIIQQKTWTWKTAVSDLVSRPARTVDTISSLPNPDGSFYVSENKRELYRSNSENNGDRMDRARRDDLHLGSVAFQSSGSSSKSDLEKQRWKFKNSFQKASFELSGERLSFFPNGFSKPLLWTSQVGGGNWISFEQNIRQGLMSLDPVKGRLLYFPKSRTQITVYEWDRQSHLIRFFPCDNTMDLLVENVPQAGLTRFSFWQDGVPKSFTVFDFTGSNRKSQVTWVDAFDCRDIVVGGNFGLQRVRY
jgi:hypothetical protein